jgi:protein involved in polysaccharide export with SLBB domain
MSRFVLLFALVLGTPGCASGFSSTGPAPGVADAPAAVVRPGDQVLLRAYREAEIADTLIVDRAGVVRVPRVGPVSVAGRPVGEVQDSIRAALGASLRNPSIDVRVLRRVGVQGAVRRPDLYMVDVTTTLRDAVALAGGVTGSGDPGKVVLIRDGERLRVGGGRDAVFQPEPLLSGDQVLVGERSWFARNTLAVVGTLAAALPTLFLLVDRVRQD